MMLDVHFVILGAAIETVGTAFYVRDTLRGDTQPNRVSFLLWGMAPLLAFAVEIQSGVGLRSLMTLVVGVSPLAVLIASFANRSAVWRVGWLDYLCGVLSVAGTVAWLVSRHGTVALVAAIAADGLAALPTIRKSWRVPDSESAGLYVAGVLNAVITLLTVRHVTAAIVAFPAYIAVIAGLEVVLVGAQVGPRWRTCVAERRRPALNASSGSPECESLTSRKPTHQSRSGRSDTW